MKNKKEIVIIILITFILNSCEQISPNKNNSFRGKGSTLITVEDSLNHYYEFREVNTKIDIKSGKEQCKNYGLISKNLNEVYSYGLNIKLFLSNMLSIPEKDISYQDENINEYSFELNYKMKNNFDLINTEIIINKVLDNYNLKLETDSIIVEAYNIKIGDSTKLNNNIYKNKIEKRSYTTKGFETDFKGITIKQLSNYLNMSNNLYHFYSEIESNSFYNFKITAKSNIKSLNQVLKEKYGLILIKDSLKIKKVVIKKTAANTV